MKPIPVQSINISVQSIKDINERDKFLANLSQAEIEFYKYNGKKTLFGYNLLKKNLNEIKGNKQLIDLSTLISYENWTIKGYPDNTVFIGIDTNGKKVEITFENTLLTNIFNPMV